MKRAFAYYCHCYITIELLSAFVSCIDEQMNARTQQTNYARHCSLLLLLCPLIFIFICVIVVCLYYCQNDDCHNADNSQIHPIIFRLAKYELVFIQNVWICALQKQTKGSFSLTHTTKYTYVWWLRFSFKWLLLRNINYVSLKMSNILWPLYEHYHQLSIFFIHYKCEQTVCVNTNKN